MKENYLFGPFVGEAIYELNYFVGHALYLRKRNPKNRIIVLTRKEHFDLYGKYATTLIPMPLANDLIPEGFGCRNIRLNAYDEIANKFKQRYKNSFKIHGHFYPKLSNYLRNVKWHYPRNEINFDFKPRVANARIADDLIMKMDNIITSDYCTEFRKLKQYTVIPSKYIFKILDISGVDNVTNLGILIEVIRKSKFVYGDIDSIIGRLAMLMKKPLITHRTELDARALSPINPYGSTVIGCSELEDGIKYLEKMK